MTIEGFFSFAINVEKNCSIAQKLHAEISVLSLSLLLELEFAGIFEK